MTPTTNSHSLALNPSLPLSTATDQVAGQHSWLGHRVPSPAAHRGRIEAAVYLPKRGRLVSGDSDGVPLVHKTATAALGRTSHWFTSHAKTAFGSIQALAVDPAEGQLLVGTDNGNLFVYGLTDTDSVQHRHQVDAHDNRITGIATDAAGTLAWTVSYDGHLACIDLAEGKVAYKQRLSEEALVGVVRCADGSLMIAQRGFRRQVLIVAPEASATRELLALEGHRNTVFGAIELPDGSLLTASADATVRRWSREDGHLLATGGGHTAWVHGLAVLEGGAKLVSAGRDHAAIVRDATTLDEVVRLHTDVPQTGVVVSDGAHRVWVAGTDMRLHGFELHAHEPTATKLGAWPDSCQVEAVALGADGRSLLVGDAAGRVKLWNLGSLGAPRIAAELGHPVTGMALHPDGRLAALSCSDGNARRLDVRTGQVEVLGRQTEARPVPVAFVNGRAEIVAGTGEPSTIPAQLAGVRIYGRQATHASRQLDEPGARSLALTTDPGGAVYVSQVRPELERNGVVKDWRDPEILRWDPATDHTRRVRSSGLRSIALALAYDAKGGVLYAAAPSGEIRRLSGSLLSEQTPWPPPPWYPGKLTEEGRRCTTMRVVVARGWLLCGLQDGTVVVRDIDQGGRVIQRFGGHDGPVRDLDCSADGTLAASCGADHSVRVWDPASGSEIARALNLDSGTLITSPAEPEDGLPSGWLWTDRPDRVEVYEETEAGSGTAPTRSPLAAGAPRREAWLALHNQRQPLLERISDREAYRERMAAWELSQRRLVPSPMKLEVSLPGAAFYFATPLGLDRALVTSKDGVGRVVDSDGELVGILRGHTLTVSSAADHPHLPLIATCGWDGTVRLWDSESFRLLHTWTHRGSKRSRQCVAFSPDGDLLACTGEDGWLTLYHVASRRCLGFLGDGFSTAEVLGISKPSGKRAERLACLRDVRRGFSFVLGRPGRLAMLAATRTAAFDGDGRHLYIAREDRVAVAVDLATGEVVREYAGHEAPLWDLALSPDGGLLATTGDKGEVQVFDVQSTERVAKFRCPGMARRVSWTGETTLRTADTEGCVRSWDVTSASAPEVLKAHDDRVHGMADLGGGLLTASWDLTARVWHDGRGTALAITPTVRPASDLTVSLETGRAAVVSPGELRTWDLLDGRTAAVLRDARVVAATWLADASLAIAALRDGRLARWRPGTDEAVPFAATSGTVHALAYEPALDRVITHEGEQICAYDAATGERCWERPSGSSPEPALPELVVGPKELVCVCDGASSLRVLSTIDGELVMRHDLEKVGITGASLSHDGCHVALGRADSKIEVARVAEPGEVATLKVEGAPWLTRFHPSDPELLLVGLWRSANGTDHGAVECWHWPSATRRWQAEGVRGRPSAIEPRPAADRVFVADTVGRLHSFALGTGERCGTGVNLAEGFLWSIPEGDRALFHCSEPRWLHVEVAYPRGQGARLVSAADPHAAAVRAAQHGDAELVMGRFRGDVAGEDRLALRALTSAGYGLLLPRTTGRRLLAKPDGYV